MKEFLEKRIEYCKVQFEQYLEQVDQTHEDDAALLIYYRNKLCNWAARKAEVELILDQYNKLNAQPVQTST